MEVLSLGGGGFPIICSLPDTFSYRPYAPPPADYSLWYTFESIDHITAIFILYKNYQKYILNM